jgi:hypothetical protein
MIIWRSRTLSGLRSFSFRTLSGLVSRETAAVGLTGVLGLRPEPMVKINQIPRAKIARRAR